MGSADEQRQLSRLWVTGRVGTLTPWSQAKVWALAKAWELTHMDTTYGRNTWIKGLVEVVTEDKRRKEHPTEQAIGKLLAKIENDPQWFPGCERRFEIQSFCGTQGLSTSRSLLGLKASQ